MPNWKKIVVSGSDATLNSLYVATDVTASNNISASSFTGGTIIVTDTINGKDLVLGPTARISNSSGGALLFLSNINASGLNITGSNILATDIKTTSASGSFSGSFEGDGSGLTGVTAASANLYTTDGTVGTNRIATIGSSLTWTGGQEIRIVNSRIIREVTQDSDLPTALVANTTYIIRGSISTSTNRTCNVEGVEILGQNRDLDEIVWTGTGAFLTLTDCSFSLQGTKFSSTTSGNSILSATNVAASGYNNGRLNVLTILNCQFRGTYDIMDINGYDLVDITNTLFFYIKATNFGLRFRDTSKLEITSCELIRWFDESTIPTPSGYATVSMIELQNNNLASFGAVNINGCIVHPQQTQNGIDIGTSSTTGFGTISSNAFINVGLTTGKVFLPEASSLPDYSQTATVKYDIFANQGLSNSTSYLYGYQVGTDTQSATTSYTQITIANFTTNISTRISASAAGVTYIGTKPIDVTFQINAGVAGIGGNNQQFDFVLYKNASIINGSDRRIELDSGEEGNVVAFALTNIVQNDLLTVYQKSPTNNGFTLQNFSIMIKE